MWLNITHKSEVQIFSPIPKQNESCLFILFTVSFVVQNLLSLIRSHLFISAFISITLGDKSKKNIAVIYAKECSACVFL